MLSYVIPETLHTLDYLVSIATDRAVIVIHKLCQQQQQRRERDEHRGTARAEQSKMRYIYITNGDFRVHVRLLLQ